MAGTASTAYGRGREVEALQLNLEESVRGEDGDWRGSLEIVRVNLRLGESRLKIE